MVMVVMMFLVVLLVVFFMFMVLVVAVAVEVITRFVFDAAIGSDSTARGERGKRYGQEQQP